MAFSLTAVYYINLAYADDVTYPSSGNPEQYTLQENSDANNTTFSIDTTELNCRYGTAGFNSHMLSWLPTLGTGWYVNFSTTTPVTSDSQFVPIIRVRQDKINGVYQNSYYTIPALTDAALGAQIAANPGALWFVGNEPDVADVQDDTYPDMYARAYHDVYNFIKQRDPSAQVGISALSMATPGRLQYLDIVWNSYLDLYETPMPVDVWNIHLYILSEYSAEYGARGDGRLALGTDPVIAKDPPVFPVPYSEQCSWDNVYCRAEHDDVSIFIEQLTAFRQWMKDHGQREKPLILSEYGQLYVYIPEGNGCFLSDEFGNCFTPTRVNNYMNATLNWLETATDPSLGYSADNNRLVQQWLWFSLRVGNETGNEESGGSSNLLKLNYDSMPAGDVTALTEVGQNYRAHIQSKTLYKNLTASRALPSVAFTNPPGNTATATLTVEFHNNGNTQINQPFNVTFYSDGGLTQEIGTVAINPVLQGCAQQTYTASVDWAGLSPGLHPYWVKVDSGNAIPENSGGSETDNNAAGIVLVDPESIYLPTVTRGVP